MDTVIIATCIGLGMWAETQLNEPALSCLGLGVLAAVIYMVVATVLSLLFQSIQAPEVRMPGAYSAGAAK